MLKRNLRILSILYIISVIVFFLIFNISNLGPFYWSKKKRNYIEENVQIWSKAAIGEYLWQHIFNGTVEIVNNGFYQNGNLTIESIRFDYFSGPGYIQTTLPQNVNYLVLILNGRTFERSLKAKEWLDYLPQVNTLKKLAVILLGNEHCEDKWIEQYLRSKGGIIDLLFIVYDSPMVDNKEVYQWPLGVATYRGFPNMNPYLIKKSNRSYICNFMGTVYQNSSRQKLVEIISKSAYKDKCFFKSRETWLPQETAESLNKYIKVLSDSFLTLSPAGKNPESYRIYEAVSMGSIPVIVMEPAQGLCVNPPLRLLFQLKAPIMKFSSWEEAIQQLLTSSELHLQHSAEQLITWYSNFKRKLAFQFVQILRKKFFPNHTVDNM